MSYATQGVKRETEEELKFGNYNLFDDPKDTFSTFNFNFNRTKFNRLTNLMEFNAKNNVDVILETIKGVVKVRVNCEHQRCKLFFNFFCGEKSPFGTCKYKCKRFSFGYTAIQLLGFLG